MAAANTQIRVRVPARRAKKVRGILSRMGTDMDNVVNMVFAQIERERRLPDEIFRFEISLGMIFPTAVFRLKGNYLGYRDCHLRGDLVIIYTHAIDVIRFSRIGSHSELFG